MNIRKAISSVMATAGVALVAAGAAMAQNTSIATLRVPNPTPTDFTFSGGIGGVFQTPTPIAVNSSGVDGITRASFFNFGPITETGAVAGGTAAFSGGSFTISTTDSTGDLLKGTFNSSALTSVNGSTGSVFNISMNGVTYTGGLYLTEYLAANPGATGAIGNLAVSLSGINPPTSGAGTGGGFTAFSAAGGVGTFDATPVRPSVPEPGTYAAFLVGGLGVLGLMVGARKRGMVA
jgi:hypothetical protein